jgi:predicted nucleic acid-binding protein
MGDLILDTGALADLLSQYFQSPDRNIPQFYQSRFLSSDAVRMINRIVQGNSRYIVAASTLGFVELVRKWDEIVRQRFSPVQIAAFIDSPPDWFSIEPMDERIVLLLGQVPPNVRVGTELKPLEWTDAVHVATALSRDSSILVTTDQRMSRIPHIRAI